MKRLIYWIQCKLIKAGILSPYEAEYTAVKNAVGEVALL